MRALLVRPPEPGVTLAEVPTPKMGETEVRVEMVEAGVCGTDRDIVAGEYGSPPLGRKDLVLGHENLGTVREVGSRVEGLHRGDWVVATVRRGCGECRFCKAGRSDYCESGRFTERGIRGRDGYFAAQYVEAPEYLVVVPKGLRHVAVLLEPLSVVEKAILVGEQVLSRTGRLPPVEPQPMLRALVTGTGAVGMLAAFALRTRGYEVTTIDRHDGTTPAARMLVQIGAVHVNAEAGIAALGERRFDLIVEASGSLALDFDLMNVLGPNGALVLTGIPRLGSTRVETASGARVRSLVLENQAVVGSVNANRTHFERGLKDLGRFRRRFGDRVSGLITERVPLDRYADVFAERHSGAMKTVLTIGAGGDVASPTN